VRNQALYRQWQILHTISSSNSSGVSKAQLAEEFGVSKKTIARDITNLSTCGFPIYADDEQDMEGHVFYFFTPGYRLPDISFSFDELLTLQMVSVFHKSYNGAFSEPFAILIKKIRSTLDPATAKFFRHLQRAVLSDTDAVLTDSDAVSKTLETLARAILNFRKVSYRYYSLQSDTHTERVVTPLSLRYFNHNFYLAAYQKDRDRVLTYALNRMSEVTILDAPAERVSFDSEAYFSSGFGIYSGETFNVKLRFTGPVCRYIAERTWFPTQKITTPDPDTLILEMPANSLSEMKKFVLSYGANVEALEPPELRELVMDELERMRGRYQPVKGKQ
jgi:predicted DNA-binding transcriptional regulator YafY